MKLIAEREQQKNFLLKDGDYKSTKEVFERIARMIPDRPILADLDENKNIVYHTAKDLLNDVESIGEGLIDLGLEGKHIAICADNSYRYILCDSSISGGVGVVTPIDAAAKEDLLITLFNKCDADAVICSAHLLEKIKSAATNCPKLQTIITIDKKVDGYVSLDEVMEKGSELAKKGYYRNKELDLAAPAKLLFTSGTTGANKGVILSQNNLAGNIINCLDLIKSDPKLDDKNTSMSILPMHHSTEINSHIFCRIAAGRLTYINDSMRNMMENMKIFKPYCITIVPMIANMFYKTIWAKAKEAGKDKLLRKGIKIVKLMRKFGKEISHKLFPDVFAPFGGNLNQIVCGGAMLNPEVVKGLADLGIIICNGYGITECGPVISMNTDTVKETYSVGFAAPSFEVKLADVDEDGIGELCVRGKSVSLGYYKDDEATKKVFDEDGFFHTGDLVTMSKNGRIYMSGRKKNVIVLENGKNVCPEEIETEVANTIEYAKECVAYKGEFIRNGAKREGIVLGLFVEDETIRADVEKIKADILALNKTLPTYKRVDYIVLVDSEYEKTSTRKVKRDTIMTKHNAENGIIL